MTTDLMIKLTDLTAYLAKVTAEAHAKVNNDPRVIENGSFTGMLDEIRQVREQITALLEEHIQNEDI